MISRQDALAWLAQQVRPPSPETVPIADAAGRVLEDALWGVECSTAAAIDGAAVRAADTQGASDYAPLPVRGVAVVAGSALPAGTDAVLPLHLWEAGCALAAVARGDGVRPADPLALQAGTLLRPPHLALLALRGLAEVAVRRRPVVALRVAGPKSGPEALLPMLQALVAAEGGVIAGPPDLVIHAGRSGPGPDDDGVRGLDSVHAHGVLIRPGETAALGTVAGTPALLLPGDPVDCATAFALLAAPVLRHIGGWPEPRPITAVLTRKVASVLGQLEAVRVRLDGEQATPLDGSMLSAAAPSDGLLLVPEGSEGYPAGARVAISLLP